MMDYRTGRDMAANLGQTVMNNPVPLALIGAGIGWFLMTGMQGSGASGQRRSGGKNAGRGGAQSQQGQAKQGQSQHGESGQGAQQGSGPSVVGKTWSAVRGSTRSFTDAAGRRADNVYRTFGDMVEEQPLLLGAAGLIIGAAMGGTLPRTRYEDSTIGETRDELARSVQEYGREQLGRAQEVVERTVDTVRQEAERQGFSLDSARQALEDVKNRATSVAQTAAEAVKNEAHLGGGGQSGGQQEGKGGSGMQAGGASGTSGSPPEANRGNDMTSGSAGAASKPPGSVEANRGNDMTSSPGPKPPSSTGGGGAGGSGGA